ncbi:MULTISPECIES: rod shape-determining protein MreD [Sphingobacterium]|uniref:Rod shape-determining protein MreD n=1 Tax=Sphingobacterium athyrii TaxID=2152717 RepID=A0A363NK94_9SPHI|nr:MULTISPECIES: rod shape-determining protein MreD [Sphingobacterium]PUV21236.1 rod shape-determining protein MreD [Sphingobacterium athyrii]QIH32421.1 rod shape-determining protein MreD [Sphingobacterium sp. DR205]
MARILIFNIIRFIVLIGMQVFLFQNIGYYNLVAAFPYILFIFLLPTGTPNFLVYLIAFLTGLTVDSFYDTLGVNTAACVALAAFRIFFMKITLEVEERDSFLTPMLGLMNVRWFFSYIFFGTLIHHTFLYLLESFSFQHIQYTLLSIVLSCIFTVIIMLLFSILFYKKKDRL